MIKIFTSPSRYIQGYGIIEAFGDYISKIGSNVFIIGGKTALSIIQDSLSKSMKKNSIDYEYAIFTGLGTRTDANELIRRATNFGPDLIIGVGGGRAIDTAKAVAYEMDLSIAVVPTIASTDAPCSAEALQYTDEHKLDREIKLKRNPDLVIVDSNIISKAPTRFFVAGMGDAIATYFEAQTCYKSYAKNVSGGLATAAGITIAELAYKIIMEYGIAAKLAVDQDVVTPAVEMVIEANILLSGLGFENCGIGAAHSIAAGLEALVETENCLHGELVGFGTIVNLIIENYPKDIINELIAFFYTVGLPISLEQLEITDISTTNLGKAADIAFNDDLFMKNLSFKATNQLVVDSIICANVLGISYRNEYKSSNITC